MKHIQIAMRKIYVDAREGVPYSDSILTHYVSPEHRDAEGNVRETHHLIVDLWLVRLYFHWDAKLEITNQKNHDTH